MEEIEIYTKVIQLDQLLKWIGIIETCGQIKDLLTEYDIYVNNIRVTEKRKKIYSDDVIEIKGIGVWKVKVKL